MERPVRSFKSFIRSVPPNPSPQNHKPLPPTPTSPDSSVEIPTSLTPVPVSSERTSVTTSWKAPAEWEWNQASPSRHSFPTSSLFSARDYSLLLPELSPGISDTQTDSGAWPFETSVLPRPQLEPLKPIQEGAATRPNVPPRNPARPSPFTILSTESDPGKMSTLTQYPQAHPPPGLSTFASTSFPDISSGVDLQTSEPRSSNFSHRVSDASMKARAFASLGIRSPRDSETPWEDSVNWAASQNRDNDDDMANLTTHSKKSEPHHQERTRIDHNLEDDGLTHKLQQLRFAQDYHKVLTEQYHDSDKRGRDQHNLLPASTNRRNHSTTAQPKTPNKDHELVPPPLIWKKDSNNPSPEGSSSNLTGQKSLTSRTRRRHKRIISWVQLPHQQQQNRSSFDQELPESSTSRPMAISPRKQGSESEVDKLLMKDIRLPNLLAHTKRLRSPREHTKAPEAKDMDQTPVEAAFPSPSPEKSSSVLRLPGGFALVRQSPSNTPRSQTVSTHNLSDLPDNSRKDSYRSSNSSSPIPASHASHTSHPRFSQHSEQSQAQVAPTMTIKKLHDSPGPASSPLSRSNNSTPPTSPLAHEVPLPRTAPPIPVSPSRPPNPPRVSSPLFYEHEFVRERHTEIKGEQSTHVHKLRDRAIGARDAWRKRQQELKHDKLKQSIRVLGPTDPAVTAGYVKREGKGSGGDNVDSNRMPGYMVTGPV